MAQQTLNTPRETTHQRIADALEDIVDKIVDTSSASNIDYDNTQSGLDAAKVQGAVDELASEKVDKVQGKGLSTNDYTTADKNKLAGIEAEANKTVVDSVMSDSSTNPLQNRVVNAFLNEKTDINNFNALTQEFELFNTYDLTNDVEISVFANETYKRDKYDRAYETHVPNLDGEYSVSLGDKTFTETCTFTIANEGKSITESFHTNRKYILGSKLLKAENDEVGDAHVIADVVTLLISKDAPFTTTFDPYLEHPPATGVLTLKVSVKPDEKYVNTKNTGGSAEYAYWGNYNGSDLLINNPILTYCETTFGQPKVSGNPVTINDAAEANAVDVSVDIEPIQAGSGTPSPDNIRPISGRSEVEINRVRKNLFDKNGTQTVTYGTATIDGEKITCTGTYYARIALDLPAGIYTVSCEVLSFSTSKGIRLFYDDNTYSDTVISSGTIDTNGKRVIAVLLYCGDGTSATTVYQNIQIEKGNTATTYEPYAGKTYTIQFGQTVYGCHVDATKGELVVDRAEVDLGSLNYTYESSWGVSSDFYTNDIQNAVKAPLGDSVIANAICSQYKIVSRNTMYNSTESAIAILTNGIMKIRDSRYTDATTFKTAVTGQQLVYELATPITIDLTPQQIKLLENTNTLYTDYEGDTIHIEYQPNNSIGEAVRAVEESYDAIIQNLLERIEALENQQ